MKYTVEIELDIPIQKVKELFEEQENLYKWQPSLQELELMSGNPVQPGAKSKLIYKNGSRKIEMIETIVLNELPAQLDCTYEAKGVFNVVSNRFQSLSENKTKWISENEFRFSGMMKLMGVFMKSAFPKETRKSMALFKSFAEEEA
ncbi:SRPBCC family protein [Reichenbachiella ulvae]|uniref:SRPBCC family protein n=1 Tax=Reichenbachiella ulvae TaxID=2980104 RepID=A0ABT3CNV6_9BACT|nr:SRPBCC family protein [Reichenbachiella ulvae]MCV9385246.1 SRPBCC family protein [Reichenbachiella ulvae]